MKFTKTFFLFSSTLFLPSLPSFCPYPTQVLPSFNLVSVQFPQLHPSLNLVSFIFHQGPTCFCLFLPVFLLDSVQLNLVTAQSFPIFFLAKTSYCLVFIYLPSYNGSNKVSFFSTKAQPGFSPVSAQFPLSFCLAQPSFCLVSAKFPPSYCLVSVQLLHIFSLVIAQFPLSSQMV